MRRIVLKGEINSAEFKKKMKESKTVAEFRRWQALYIIKSIGLKAEEVADLIGVSKKTIIQWVYYYNNEGMKAMYLLGRGGRREKCAFMSWKEEEEFLNELSKDAKKGLVIISKTVKKKVEEKLGKEVSKDYPYDLLHRHGWRKVKGRPKHPKSDKKIQESFKKKFQTYWQAPY